MFLKRGAARRHLLLGPVGGGEEHLGRVAVVGVAAVPTPVALNSARSACRPSRHPRPSSRRQAEVSRSPIPAACRGATWLCGLRRLVY
jgi:hypothetical protein